MGSPNLYQYVGNNPASYTDPFGLCPPEDDNYDDCAPTSPHYWANREVRGEGSSILNNVAGVAATIAENLTADQCSDCLTGIPPAVGPSAGANAARAVRLGKSLASRAQMASKGTQIAGGSTGVAFRDAGRIAQTYGGRASDWAKMTSRTYKAKDGSRFQTHWVENLVTGARVELKTKLLP